MKISSRKAKARQLQQWAAKKISRLIKLEYGVDQPIASREMGQSGTDVRLLPEALERFPWSVECKRQENMSVPSWIKQAQSNLLPHTDWLLICKRNREKPIIILDADVFFEVLKRIPKKRKGRKKRGRRK